jgi:hypothetical protein
MALVDRPVDHALQVVGIEPHAVRHRIGACALRRAAQALDPLQELRPGLPLAGFSRNVS